MAVALAALATLATAGVRPVIETYTVNLYVVALALAAWYGGLGPGLLATALSAAALDFFFVPPYFAFVPITTSDTVRVALFAASGLTISWVSHLLRRAVRDVAEGAERLAASEALFRHTFEQAAVGVAHVGLDGRWLRLNDRLAEILGYTCEELLARTFQDVTHPEDLGADVARVEALLRGEASRYAMDKRYRCKDGGTVWVRLTVSLVRDADGRPDYFISVVEDISARKRGEADLAALAAERARLLARAEGLQALTAALSQAVTPADVVEAAVREAGRGAGSRGGAFALLDPEARTFTLVAGPGITPEIESTWVRWPNAGRLPGPEAVRTGAPVYSRTRAEYVARDPALGAVAAQLGIEAEATLPLVVGGRALGVLTLLFAAPHAFGPEDDAFLRAVADQCAQALERARLFEAERRARGEAEAAALQLQEQAAELEAANEELQTAAADLEERTDEAERRRAEAEAAEARYRALFTSLAVGFCVIEMLPDAGGRPVDYRFVEANPAFARQTGLVDAVGRTARELVPGLEQHWVDLYGRVARTGEPAHFQQGSEAMGRWFDVHAFRVGQPTEHRVGVLFTDVSAAKAAERERERLLAALAAERARLAAVFEQAPVAVAVLRGRAAPDLVFELANPRYLEMLPAGRAPLGRRLADALPEVAAALSPVLQRVLDTGAPFLATDHLVPLDRDGDGAPEDYHFNFVYHPLVEGGGADGADRTAGAVAGVVGVGTEVTESVRARREAERRRAEAEAAGARTARLLAAADAFTAAGTVAEVAAAAVAQAAAALGAFGGSVALVVDAAGGAEGQEDVEGGAIPAAEAAFVYAAGYPAAELEKWRRFPLAAATPFGDAIRAAAPVLVESPEAWATRYPHLVGASEAAGNRSLAAVPLPGAGGRVLGVLGLGFAAPRAFDAADRAYLAALAQQAGVALERARLLEAERGLRARAEAASTAKSQFLATVSHEIRTPINGTLGFLQLLDLDLAGPLAPEQRRYVGRAQTATRHLLGIVNEILDLAKVESGQMTVARERAAAAEAVAAAVPLVEPLAAAGGLALVADPAARDPSAALAARGDLYLGDPARVRQILVNLLSNAVKFTPAGGRVTVAVGTAPAGPGAAPGGRVLVRVADTGVGIPPDRLEHVFEPFVQVEQGQGSVYTRSKGGTGLGLAISRELARLMGGDLTAESRVGAGSTFTLWLPAAPAPAGADASHAAPARGPGAVGRALTAGLLTRIVRAHADRLRADPAVPLAAGAAEADLEDHTVSLLADVAQALVVLDERGGVESATMRDGSDIQRLIAERHGAQRARLGWGRSALEREFVLLDEGVEAAVREVIPAPAAAADGAALEAALTVLRRFLARAAAVSRAAFLAAPGGAPAEGPERRADGLGAAPDAAPGAG